MLKSFLLAITMIAGWALAAAHSAPVALASAGGSIITPDSGSITDAQGNVWDISASGSIRENGQWTPGGGGTSALEILKGTVYGQDAKSHGWYTFGTSAQVWTPSSPPADVTATAPLQPVSTSTGVFPPDVTGTGPTATIATTATPSTTPVLCGGGTAQSAFGILPVQAGGVGQIFDPAGQPYVPRGVNVLEGQEVPVGTLQANMQGINFVRYAIYDYPDPSKIAPYVTSLNQAGIVVELENHSNGAGNAGGSGGSIFTGGQLSQESSWYASVAKYFINDPYVWFGTNNEPSETDANGQSDPAGLSSWQSSTYQAIRGTGNQSPIMLEMNGWADPSSFGQGYDTSAYAKMSNVIWDMHFYGWVTNMSTNQAANDSFLSGAVQQAQKITAQGGTKMPVLIGEYGNSTTGQAIDPNGVQVVNAVQNGVKNGVVSGSSAWAYMQGGPGDGLIDGGGSLTSYGKQVASYLQQPVGSAASAYACPTSGTQTAANTNTPPTSAPPPSTSVLLSGGNTNAPTAPDEPAPQAPSQPAVNTNTLQTMSSQADANAAAIQAQIDALSQQPPTPSLQAVGASGN